LASDRVTKSYIASRYRKCQLDVAIREKRPSNSRSSFDIPGGFPPTPPETGSTAAGRHGRPLFSSVQRSVEFKRRSFMPYIGISIADIDDQLAVAR
jgi:hypothetical protein